MSQVYCIKRSKNCFILTCNLRVKTDLENIELSKLDWDLWETSWDFKKHSLINEKFTSIEAAYNNFKSETDKRFNQLKNNQQKLNKMFIELYKLNSVEIGRASCRERV